MALKLRLHSEIATPHQDHHTKSGTKMRWKGTRKKEMVLKHHRMDDNYCPDPGARQRSDQLDAFEKSPISAPPPKHPDYGTTARTLKIISFFVDMVIVRIEK